MPRFFLFTKVFTFVGLPGGLPAARFLRIADFLSAGLIRAALDAGKHFGYIFAPDLLRPHFSKPPPFLGLDISTQFSPNHLVKLTAYLLEGHFLPFFFFMIAALSPGGSFFWAALKPFLPFFFLPLPFLEGRPRFFPYVPLPAGIVLSHAVFTALGFVSFYKPTVCIRRRINAKFSFCSRFNSCV